MNEIKFCEILQKNGFNFYSGVPCSILKKTITYLSTNQKFEYISATREDEAIGISVGAHIGGKQPVVLMQNSGLGVSITALASLAIMYKVPMLLIISWRGFEGKDAPEHLIMGDIMMKLLDDMKITTKVLTEENIESEISYLKNEMILQKKPVAAIIKRGVIE